MRKVLNGYECKLCSFKSESKDAARFMLYAHIKKKHPLEFIPTGDDCGEFGDINLTPLVELDENVHDTESEVNLNTETNVNLDSQTEEILQPSETSELS